MVYSCFWGLTFLSLVPKATASELQNWKSSINADAVAIVFAGAYANNPASMFGHTFLRFFKRAKQNQRPGGDLLTYTAGYLAATDPNDSAPVYAYKGLTGGYAGVYDVGPFYLNVGLYNNAEARDLWEYTINLSPQEVDLLLTKLWELQHRSSRPYYFFTQNCAYGLLSLLESARPDLDLTSHLHGFVLPLDTLRVLQSHGLLETESPRFRSSVRRRLNEKIERMSLSQRMYFEQALGELSATQNSRDPLVLDALIDYWTYRNYKEKTFLPLNEKSLYEATLMARSQTLGDSVVSENELKLKSAGPPHLGHLTSWISLGAFQFQQSKDNTKLFQGMVSARLGAHSLIAPADGYDDFAAIEYLGLDWGPEKRFLFASIYSLQEFNWAMKRFSWRVFADINTEGAPHLIGGFGLSFGGFYLMPQMQVLGQELDAGYEVGVKKHWRSWIFWTYFLSVSHQLGFEWGFFSTVNAGWVGQIKNAPGTSFSSVSYRWYL